MTSTDFDLPQLERGHPEWKPWLSVIRELLHEAADPRWDAVVPTRIGEPQGNAPLLAGAALVVDEGSVRRVLKRLIRVSRQNGTREMASLERAVDVGLDLARLFTAALQHDVEGLSGIAGEIGAPPAALHGIATLLPIPFLRACQRRWAHAIDRNWTEGYCPVCGAWPAFGEVRGIERRRYLRCSRCGAEWESQCLDCPYCRTTDHQELVQLVPENGRANAVVDACRRCRGYVKTLTRLQGSAPASVLLDDLATVDLDVAALEQSFERPGGTGYPLTVTIG